MTETKSTGRVSGFIRYTLNISSKQLWLLVLWSVFLLFAYPIAMAMGANSYINHTAERIDSALISTTTMLWYILPVLAFVFSHGFGYLNSRSKLDFYHSQPVTRTKLFAANYLNGLLLFLIPLAVMMPAGLTAAYASAESAKRAVALEYTVHSIMVSLKPVEFNATLLFTALLYTVLLFFVFYSLAVLCRMLCGNTVIAILIYTFVSMLPSLLSILSSFHMQRFSLLFSSSGYVISDLFVQFKLISELQNALTEKDGLLIFNTGVRLAAACAIGAAAAILAAFLYRFRRSEKAGAAVAIRGVVPIIKYPLVTVMILFGGFVFFNLSGSSLFWEISGYVLFGLLAFMLVNVLEKFDFRNILASLWKSVFCFAAAALFVGGVYAYAGYYDSVPDAQDVSEISFVSASIYNGDISLRADAVSEVVVTDRDTINKLITMFDTMLTDGDAEREDGSTLFAIDAKLKTGFMDAYKSYTLYAAPDDTDELTHLLAKEGVIPDLTDAGSLTENFIYLDIRLADPDNVLYSGTLTAEAAQALGSDLSGSGYGTELHISLSGKNCSAYFSIDEGGALSEYLNGVSSVIPE